MPRVDVPHVALPHVAMPHMSAPKINPPTITPPSINRPSNQEVGVAAAKGSRLMAAGWWIFRTSGIRHRVTMFRLYSSTVRTPKRPPK
jgi:hypothetical protein